MQSQMKTKLTLTLLTLAASSYSPTTSAADTQQRPQGFGLSCLIL